MWVMILLGNVNDGYILCSVSSDLGPNRLQSFQHTKKVHASMERVQWSNHWLKQFKTGHVISSVLLAALRQPLTYCSFTFTWCNLMTQIVVSNRKNKTKYFKSSFHTACNAHGQLSLVYSVSVILEYTIWHMHRFFPLDTAKKHAYCIIKFHICVNGPWVVNDRG